MIFDKQKNKVYIVGILNATPDSFYDGGQFCNIEKAVNRAKEMIAEGADIIDVGGMSTRPGHTEVSDDLEIERTSSVIAAIKKVMPDTKISIDTYKSSVAANAIKSGAFMVNDVWGLQYDSSMASLIASSGAMCVLMHNSSTEKPSNLSTLEWIVAGFNNSLDLAKKAKIKKEKIILDIGIGFGKKTVEQNLQAIKAIDKLKKLGYPIYVGLSNKSFLGGDKNDRLEKTIAKNLQAINLGATYIRVHNVKEHYKALFPKP